MTCLKNYSLNMKEYKIMEQHEESFSKLSSEIDSVSKDSSNNKENLYNKIATSHIYNEAIEKTKELKKYYNTLYNSESNSGNNEIGDGDPIDLLCSDIRCRLERFFRLIVELQKKTNNRIKAKLENDLKELNKI